MQQHRRVNTEGPPPMMMQNQSRNACAMHGYSGANNILVDGDAEEDAEDTLISVQTQQQDHQVQQRQNHQGYHQRVPGASEPAIGDIDGEDDEDDEDFGLDNIDAEQLRQMMSDPRYAALFAAHCKFFISIFSHLVVKNVFFSLQMEICNLLRPEKVMMKAMVNISISIVFPLNSSSTT